MKYFSLFLIYSFSLGLLLSCASFKVPPGQYQGDQIFWGSGGGFVGKELGYVLLDNGEVYKLNKMGGFDAFKKLSTESTTQIFANAQNIGLEKIKWMKPGNTYRFIQINKEGTINRVSWSDQTEDAPGNVKTFYDVLNRKVADL